jgi:hypothetical protein
MSELFGSQVWIDVGDFWKLVVRFLLNLLFVTAVVRGVYFRFYQRRDYVFTYFLLNIITFTLAFLLRKVPIELGFALGLFAVFGILRYRTEAIPIRDLTYLFVVIGLALVNALSNKRISVAELVFVNVAIVLTTLVLEGSPLIGRESSKSVRYDRLDLLGLEHRSELQRDLRRRTGLPVERFNIDRIDLLRDTADITVFYAPEPVRDGEG